MGVPDIARGDSTGAGRTWQASAGPGM